jgi:hypothetical protein
LAFAGFLARSPVSLFEAPKVPPLPFAYFAYRDNSYPSLPVDYECFLPFGSFER